jgi:TolA-binding protein
MSEPTRLLAGEASDFEKELLGSWDAEQPSDASRAKVLALVGVGAGTAAVGAAAVKIAGGAGSLAPKAAAVGTAAIAKWALVGAVSVAAVGAAAGYVHHERQVAAAAHAAHAAAPPPKPAEMTLQAAPPSGAQPPASLAPERTSEDAPPRNVVAPRHAPSAARAPDPTLGDEVTALDRARRAMTDGDAAGALRRLDDYEAHFSRGALVEEAQVLRIEALLAEGDRGAAARVASRFLAAHPSSPHAARVRALLEQVP